MWFPNSPHNYPFLFVLQSIPVENRKLEREEPKLQAKVNQGPGGEGGGGYILQYNGALAVQEYVPQPRPQGCSHFLREKPWGRGWYVPQKRDTFRRIQAIQRPGIQE